MQKRKKSRLLANPYMKFQDDISFRNITIAKFQCRKFTKRAITKNIICFFSIFHQNSIHHPLSAYTSFINTFRNTAFTKSHPLFFKRAVILQGEIIRKKNFASAIFP